MSLPQITGENLKKPLCYDPSRKKFILFDEIVARRENIVPLDRLTPADQKQLVIERNRRGKDYKVQHDWGADPFSQNDVIAAIERDDAFGKVAVEAELSYLKELLEQIETHLRGKAK